MPTDSTPSSSTAGDTTDTRAPLSRDRILDAAIAIADADGVAGLSMRNLARSLDYEVMSLYNHVANKDDLLDGMVDRVAGEIDDPPPGVDWRDGVRSIAVSAHGALIRHGWAAGLWTTRWPGPNRWHHMEVLLDLLARVGFPDDLADLAFHAVTLHIQGFTQQQLSYAMQPDDETEMFERFRREVTADEYPRVVEHVQFHLDTETRVDEFSFVLDLILDGLERKRLASRR